MIWKIAFVGSHGSGKTTTCNRLTTMLDDFEIITHRLVIEKARLCPYPLDTYTGQMWLVDEQIRDEARHERELATYNNALIVCDRSIWDSLVYATYLNRAGKLSDTELRIIDGRVSDYAENHPYDAIYLCDPKELYDDPKRPKNKDYQLDIFKTYKEIVKERGIKVTMVQ